MKIIYVLITSCFAVCFLTSCTDEKNGFCNAGTFNEIFRNEKLYQSHFQVYYGTVKDQTVYYEYDSSGKVRFSSGMTLSNICPATNVTVPYSLQSTEKAQPKNFTLVGDASWNTLTGSYRSAIFVMNGAILPEQIYEGENELELTEAFGDEMAEVNVFIGVEFDTLSSFQEDSTYFVDHLLYIQLEAKGVKYQ